MVNSDGLCVEEMEVHVPVYILEGTAIQMKFMIGWIVYMNLVERKMIWIGSV